MKKRCSFWFENLDSTNSLNWSKEESSSFDFLSKSSLHSIISIFSIKNEGCSMWHTWCLEFFSITSTYDWYLATSASSLVIYYRRAVISYWCSTFITYISSSWSCWTCLGLKSNVHHLHEWLMGFVFECENLGLKFIFNKPTILAEFGKIFSAAGFVGSVISDEFGKMRLAGVKALVGRH